MTKIDRTPQQLVLKSGSTTLVLDKEAGRVVRQRKVLMWALKPMEIPLTEIAEVTVDAAVDRASGVEVCSTTLVMRTGAGWALPAADKKDAATTAAAVRDFLGIRPA